MENSGDKAGANPEALKKTRPLSCVIAVICSGTATLILAWIPMCSWIPNASFAASRV
jgi:hypothetical protein